MDLITKLFKRIYYKFLVSKKFFYSTFVSFIAILLGFFLANTLATMLGQTGDWGILSSGILVAFIESTNRVFYDNKKKLWINQLLAESHYLF
jgi:ABC-type nitrate/sulfonate/bicarbonate transport system permease component